MIPFIETCEKDHMHKWELLHDDRWYCTTQLVVARPTDADMAYVIRNIEWVSVKPPVLKGLAQLVADAKEQLDRDIESSVLGELVRRGKGEPRWLQAARDHEAHKDLYGNDRNYRAMISAIQDLNRGRGSTRVTNPTATTTESSTI